MLFAWNDALSWRPLIAALAGKRRSAHSLGAVLASQYTGVLVYHGCRAEDVTTYYQRGLLCSSGVELDAKARSLFLTSEFPEITPQQLDAAISKLGVRDEGRIYACLDHRHVLEEAGHYLIYGSERLCAIATALCTNTSIDYRQVLKRNGRPTLLHVGLQWRHVAEADFEQLSELVSENLPAIREVRSLPLEMFSFEWWTALPATAILTHEQPRQLDDPLLSGTTYVFGE